MKAIHIQDPGTCTALAAPTDRCRIDGCDRNVRIKKAGLCKWHYEQDRQERNPEAKAVCIAYKARRHQERWANEPEYRERIATAGKRSKARPEVRARIAERQRMRRLEDPLRVWAIHTACALRKKGVSLTSATLIAAYVTQGGRCAVCAVELEVGAGRKHVTCACADHCHTALKFRGVLCYRCNVMVGNHTAARLLAGAAYVEARR